MAWWRVDEEPDPQSRVGGATRRPAPTPRPRRRGVRIPWQLVAALALVVFVVAGSVIALIASIDGGGGGTTTNPERTRDRSRASLVPHERFARALALVEKEAGPEASLVALRLDTDRLWVVVRRSGGGRAVIQVSPDLEVSSTAAGEGGPRGLSLNRIDPAVPERLARAAAERRGRRPEEIGYIALTSIPVGGGGIWSVFFTNGGGDPPVTAGLDGSIGAVP
jgi:hypothetical protein